MKATTVLAAIGCGLLQCVPARAIAVQSLETSRREGVYRITLVVRLEAPVDAVAAVLTDYVGYRLLDPRIRASTILPPDQEGSELVQTVVRVCAGLFCRNVERVERVQRGDSELIAVVIPELSELRRGLTRTTWQAADVGTDVTYEAEFVPDFWVPTVIGRRFVERALRTSTIELFENVEQRARER